MLLTDFLNIPVYLHCGMYFKYKGKLTIQTALAEFFARILSHHTGARIVAWRAWMITRDVVVSQVGLTVAGPAFLLRGLPAPQRPRPEKSLVPDCGDQNKRGAR